MKSYYHPIPEVWDLKEKPNHWRIWFLSLLALVIGFSFCVLISLESVSAEKIELNFLGSSYIILKE